MASGDLKDIHVASGINHKLEGFCTISINNGDLLGQLSPAEVRAMALQWLEVAEAAESDSIIARMLTEDVGLDLEIAGVIIANMRDRRGGVSRETEG